MERQNFTVVKIYDDNMNCLKCNQVKLLWLNAATVVVNYKWPGLQEQGI